MSDRRSSAEGPPPPSPGVESTHRQKNEYIRPGLELLAGGRQVALPLAEAREVAVEQAPISYIPRTLPPIRGAIGVRGRVVALVELAGLLGLQPLVRDPSLCRVVLLEGAAVALWVEEVVGICELEGRAAEETLSARWVVEQVERMLGPTAATMDYLGGRASPGGGFVDPYEVSGAEGEQTKRSPLARSAG